MKNFINDRMAFITMMLILIVVKECFILIGFYFNVVFIWWYQFISFILLMIIVSIIAPIAGRYDAKRIIERQWRMR